MRGSGWLSSPPQQQAPNQSGYRPEYGADNGVQGHDDYLRTGSVPSTTPIQIEVNDPEGSAEQQAEDTTAHEPRTTGESF
jgi:hypothetical protein